MITYRRISLAILTLDCFSRPPAGVQRAAIAWVRP